MITMRLYEGTTSQFVEDAAENRIPKILSDNFEAHYHRPVNPYELQSWNNSTQFVKNLVDRARLKDNMIALEYEVPYSTKRIDCLLFGHGLDQSENIVLIELKQWSVVEPCEIELNVITVTGGGKKIVPHPSAAAWEYAEYLEDDLEVFSSLPPLNLSSIAYCHNYSKEEPAVLFAPQFDEIRKKSPLFSKEDFSQLAEYLKEKLGQGTGWEVFNRLATSRLKPSKSLIKYAKAVVEGQSVFHLLEEQLAANNTIIDRAKKSSKLKRKTVILVRGGPGTGKSVIALNALCELLSIGKTVFHATGSKAFTSSLRKLVGTRLQHRFKYFFSFPHKTTSENEIDVLICDEAHRIRKNSNHRYTRTAERSELTQIEELIRVAKVSVFFIDDCQIVRPYEIGSSQLILDTGNKFGADIYDFELKSQFRCNGSDGYLNWVDNALDVRQTANITLTKAEKFDFKIFSNPSVLREAIREKNIEKKNSARLVAGFCWKWSNPKTDGTLEDDVVIGDFRATWEAKNEATNLAKGIPRAMHWAIDERAEEQVGSIYTIPGFEFDYVGVIFGPDLIYDWTKKEWIGHPEGSADKEVKRAGEAFAQLVKNAYRILLTRGMKGCYVYFVDKGTEDYFRSLIDTDLLG